MPDIGNEIISIVSATSSRHTLHLHLYAFMQLDEEFRYLQRKKNVVIELLEVRLKVRALLALVYLATCL